MTARHYSVLMAALFCAFVYCRHNPNEGNQASRMNLLRAVFFHRSLTIDADHLNTADKANYLGHYYSDKPPGIVVLAMPAFALANTLWKAQPDSELIWINWATCAGSVAIIAALGGVAMMAWLGRWIPARPALIVTMALSLGAAPIAYAGLLFPHAAVVGLIAVALWLMGAGSKERRAGSVKVAAGGEKSRIGFPKRLVLSGAAAGMAVACEYTAGLVAVGLFAFLLADNWRRALWFAVGSLPPLMLIPAYHWACFGNPFTIAYGHQAVFKQMHSGLYGIGWPDLGNAMHLLFSWERGLFVWTPFLVLVLAGYPRLYALSPRLFWLTYLVPLLQVIVISGYYDIPAGRMIWPRYLACVLPLLALPAALGLAQFRRLGLVLAIISIAFTGGATLINTRLPSGVANPLLDYYWPEFLAGNFTNNLGHLMGLTGHWSLLPLLLVMVPGFWWLWRKLPGEKPDPLAPA